MSRVGCLLTAVAAAAVIIGCAAVWYTSRQTLPPEIRVAAGQPDGLYHTLARAYADRLQRRVGRPVRVIPTTGTAENVALLRDGGAELALIQTTSLNPDGVAGVAPLFPEPLHLLARRGRGIGSPADLAGRRVALGLEGSSIRQNARAVLAHYGVAAGDVRDAGHFGAVGTDPGVDAAVVTTGWMNPQLEKILRGGDVELVGLPDPEAVAARHPWLVPAAIPPGLYSGRPAGGPGRAGPDGRGDGPPVSPGGRPRRPGPGGPSGAIRVGPAGGIPGRPVGEGGPRVRRGGDAPRGGGVPRPGGPVRRGDPGDGAGVDVQGGGVRGGGVRGPGVGVGAAAAGPAGGRGRRRPAAEAGRVHRPDAGRRGGADGRDRPGATPAVPPAGDAGQAGGAAGADQREGAGGPAVRDLPGPVRRAEREDPDADAVRSPVRGDGAGGGRHVVRGRVRAGHRPAPGGACTRGLGWGRTRRCT